MKKILSFSIILITLGVTELMAQTPATADSWKRFYSIGEKLRSQKLYDKALLEYDHALLLVDTMPQVYNGKGICYFMTSEEEKSIAMFEKAISVNIEYVPAYKGLINVYKNKQDIHSLVATYQRLVRVEKKTVDKVQSLVELSSLLLDLKDPHEAHKHIKEAKALLPHDVDVLYTDARVNNELGHAHEAIKSMTEALSLVMTQDPKVTAKLHYELGLAYFNAKEYDNARESFKKANFGPFKQMIMRMSPEYFYNLSVVYSDMYDLDKAEENLKMAVEIDPSFSKGHMLLGDIAIKKEHHNKAIHHYEAASQGEVDPNTSVMMFRTYIDILLNTKKYPAAVEVCDLALSKHVSDRNILFMKCVALEKEDKVEGAIALVQKLLQEKNLSPYEGIKYQFVYGLALAKAGKKEDAIKAFTESRKGPYAYAAQVELERLKEVAQ